MDCELCGRPDANIIAVVEGIKMTVCEKCSKYGKEIGMLKDKKEERAEKRGEKKSEKTEIELELVEDYGKKIKAEREKKGMSLKQLASAIAEKESYIDRIENEDVIPSEKVARKLEKFFNIKLLEEIVTSSGEIEIKDEDTITLGDIIEIKKKNKK
jgi:putative transcription factor